MARRTWRRKFRTIFGPGKCWRERLCESHILIDGNGPDMIKLKRRDTVVGRKFKRGVVSHFTARRAGVIQWMRASANISIIMTRVHDDASTWVNLPPTLLTHVTGASLRRRLEEAMKKKSNLNRVCAFLNMKQELMSRSADDKEVSFVTVEAPAHFLPKANLGTVARLLRRWGVLFGGRPGDLWRGSAGGDTIMTSLSGTFAVVSLSTQDALITSRAVHGLEKRGFFRLRASGDLRDMHSLMLSQNCVVHQACLTRKPGFMQLSGLPTYLVRSAIGVRTQEPRNVSSRHVINLSTWLSSESMWLQCPWLLRSGYFTTGRCWSWQAMIYNQRRTGTSACSSTTRIIRVMVGIGASAVARTSWSRARRPTSTHEPRGAACRTFLSSTDGRSSNQQRRIRAVAARCTKLCPESCNL